MTCHEGKGFYFTHKEGSVRIHGGEGEATEEER